MIAVELQIMKPGQELRVSPDIPDHLDVVAVLLGIPLDSTFEMRKIDYMPLSLIQNVGIVARYMKDFLQDSTRSLAFYHDAESWNTVLAASCVRLLVDPPLR